MTVKSPALSGVTATSVFLPTTISVSNLSGFDMKPCTRSMLVTRRITGSPFLSVITFGVNSNFFAVISITLGFTSARARSSVGAAAIRAILHATARNIAMTTLFFMKVVSILLLVLCVSGSVFEHLIHSDGARVLGRYQLHFLELQIVASRVA